MPWTPLHTAISDTNTVGDSLSTINSNFFNIDYYLEHLSYTGFDGFLYKNLNLSDVPNKPTARTNLELTGDIAAFKDRESVPQAHVSFNPNSTSIVNGETLCAIIDSYNVSAVVKTKYYIEIRYESPLKYVGPVISDIQYPNAVRLSTSSAPNATFCRIVTSVLRGQNVLSRIKDGLTTDCSYISVVSF